MIFRPEIRLILDNIRSVHNVGSIFRTADAAGVSKIYCVGTTPAPVDRFGRKRKDIAKVSLGAEESVIWELIEKDDIENMINGLKKDDFTMIALEQDSGAKDYRDIFAMKHGKVVIILGNEIGGVSKELMESVDFVAEIPMRGKKESLNVSVAAGIALFTLV